MTTEPTRSERQRRMRIQARRERLAATMYTEFHRGNNVRPWVDVPPMFKDNWYRFVDVAMKVIAEDVRDHPDVTEH